VDAQWKLKKQALWLCVRKKPGPLRAFVVRTIPHPFLVVEIFEVIEQVVSFVIISVFTVLLSTWFWILAISSGIIWSA